jgi:hypothetical protein
VYTCDPDVEVEPAPANQVMAGDITVTGFASPLPLDWNETASGYLSTPVTDWLWETPVNVTVTVTGSADVPAYSMQLTTPTPVTVTAPVLDDTFEISRSTDIEMTWTGGAEGTVQFVVSGTNAPDSYTVTCNADASGGSLTVEAAALAGLPDEAGVVLGQYATATQTIDDWSLIFEAVQQHGAIAVSVGD